VSEPEHGDQAVVVRTSRRSGRLAADRQQAQDTQATMTMTMAVRSPTTRTSTRSCSSSPRCPWARRRPHQRQIGDLTSTGLPRPWHARVPGAGEQATTRGRSSQYQQKQLLTMSQALIDAPVTTCPAHTRHSDDVDQLKAPRPPTQPAAGLPAGPAGPPSATRRYPRRAVARTRPAGLRRF